MKAIQPSAARTSRLWSTTCPLAASATARVRAAASAVPMSCATLRSEASQGAGVERTYRSGRRAHRRDPGPPLLRPDLLEERRELGVRERLLREEGARAPERRLDDLADRDVDLAGGLLRVQPPRAGDLPEEAVRLRLVRHRSEPIAHAVAGHHVPRDVGRLREIVRGAGREVAIVVLLGGATT